MKPIRRFAAGVFASSMISGVIAAPTPGNHEWANRAEGYDPYWKAAGLVTNRHFYSFRTAGWEIISLNSESGLERGSPQRRWLERRVRRRGTCRIAFWHRPFQNAGRPLGTVAGDGRAGQAVRWCPALPRARRRPPGRLRRLTASVEPLARPARPIDHAPTRLVPHDLDSPRHHGCVQQ